MNVEIRAKAVQLLFWEYINGIFIEVQYSWSLFSRFSNMESQGGDSEIFGLANT